MTTRLKMGTANPFNDSPLRSTAVVTPAPGEQAHPQIVRPEAPTAVVQLAPAKAGSEARSDAAGDEEAAIASTSKNEARRPRGAPKKLEEPQRKCTAYADASAVAAVEYEVFRRRQAGDLIRASDLFREMIHAWAKKHPIPK